MSKGSRKKTKYFCEKRSRNNAKLHFAGSKVLRGRVCGDEVEPVDNCERNI